MPWNMPSKSSATPTNTPSTNTSVCFGLTMMRAVPRGSYPAADSQTRSHTDSRSRSRTRTGPTRTRDSPTRRDCRRTASSTAEPVVAVVIGGAVVGARSRPGDETTAAGAAVDAPRPERPEGPPPSWPRLHHRRRGSGRTAAAPPPPPRPPPPPPPPWRCALSASGHAIAIASVLAIAIVLIILLVGIPTSEPTAHTTAAPRASRVSQVSIRAAIGHVSFTEAGAGGTCQSRSSHLRSACDKSSHASHRV